MALPTLQLCAFPEVIKALKAPQVFKRKLVVEVPKEKGHEDDEESDGGQKPQHLWRNWDTGDEEERGRFKGNILHAARFD